MAFQKHYNKLQLFYLFKACLLEDLLISLGSIDLESINVSGFWLSMRLLQALFGLF